MTNPELYEKIHHLSKLMGFKVPLDGFMMMVLQKPVIDIIKLDERLVREFNYSGSMANFIKKQYGMEAFEILELLT